jgi:diacylglycerol O-acyltransferase / wax synthase
MERLSPQDLITLWPEQVGSPQDMGAVAVLEGGPLATGDGGVRMDEVRALVEGRAHLAPRLRQVVHTPPWGLGRPLWVDAQGFDISHHVRARPLPTPASESELLAAVEALRRTPLDPSRPMWEMWLLPGMSDHRIGLYLRVHHVLADGPAVVALLGAILDHTPERATEPAPRWAPAKPPPARDLLEDKLHRYGAALTRGADVVAGPAQWRPRLRTAGAAVRSTGFTTRAPRTSLNQPIGRDRRLVLARSDLTCLRDAARRRDASINDILLASVAGGLRELLRSRGERVDDLVLRAIVPIALPHPDRDRQHGNVLGQMVVPLPLGITDPVERLRHVTSQTRQTKRGASPRRLPVLRSHTLQRAAMRVATHQRFYNVYVANIHGPTTPLYLAGAEMLDVLPIVPLMGNLTLGVGALSYAGQFNVVTVGDHTTCPDLSVFGGALRTALQSLTTR